MTPVPLFIGLAIKSPDVWTISKPFLNLFLKVFYQAASFGPITT